MTDDQQPTTPPTNHEPVNQWMLGNGWEWVDRPGYERVGWWHKDGIEDISQDLAAEMWRMAEGMADEARINQIENDYATFRNYGFAEMYYDELVEAEKDVIAEINHESGETK